MSEQNDLTKLHRAIMIILNEIKRICEENDIKYILAGGSCLGAVRHDGFIPWDDDADLEMTRDNYEKFRSLCLEGKLSEGFSFQDKETDPHYGGEGFCRIRLDGTRCIIRYHKEKGYNHLGVFVDIFPIDYSYTDNIKKIKKWIRKDQKYSRFIANKSSPNLPTFRSKVLRALLVFTTREKLLTKRSKIERIMDRPNNRKVGVSLPSRYSAEQAVFPSSLHRNLVMHKFEDGEFLIPSDYDTYLTIIYGKSYMTPPPPDQRVAHLPVDIDIPDEILNKYKH